MKTTVTIDKSDLVQIEGNKSKFIREAIKEKLGSEISLSKKANKIKLRELKVKKDLLLLEIDELDNKRNRIKEFMEL